MKITIERGKRKYEVVPCGRRCSFCKPERLFDGRMDFCITKCRCPEWFKKVTIDIEGEKCIGGYCGLREIGGAK